MPPHSRPEADYDPLEIDPATTLRERIRLESARLQYPPAWSVGQDSDGRWRAELGIGLVGETFVGDDELAVLQGLLNALRRARGSR